VGEHGGAKRFFPVAEAAYGMPRKAHTPCSVSMPRTVPGAVVTAGAAVEVIRGGGLVDAYAKSVYK
jgi:hypothetical protein